MTTPIARLAEEVWDAYVDYANGETLVFSCPEKAYALAKIVLEMEKTLDNYGKMQTLSGGAANATLARCQQIASEGRDG